MSTAQETHGRFDLPAALLWASAFVLFGLLIVQASRLGTGNAAFAGDSASTIGDLSALTLSDGDEKDVLLVLDGREQELFVYTLQGSQRINAPTVVNLKDAFNSARGTPTKGGGSSQRRGR